jgi:hypothetical protein
MIFAYGGAGAAVAAAAAEARRLSEQQEEEEMTSYRPQDLAEGWEFKILRSNLNAFRKPERLRAILEEEKRGGWTLVEKFDDARIRLKRPAGTKVVEEDLASGYDPYRTVVGASPRIAVLTILGAIAVFFFIMLLLFIAGI